MATTDINHNDQALWYLVFTKAEQPHTIHRFLHPDFQHVFAMKKSPGGQFWQILDPAHSHTHLTLESTEQYPSPWDYRPHAIAVLAVLATYDRLEHNKHVTFITCVDMMKSILGIKHTLCLTPYQLFKNLIGGRYEQRIKTWRERSEKSSARTEETLSGEEAKRRTENG